MSRSIEAIHDESPPDRSLCVVTPYLPSATETFIRGHIEDLPARVVLVHGWRPSIGDQPILSGPRLAVYKVWRTLTRTGLDSETTAAYLQAFRRHHVEAVLAEYGEMGVLAGEACRLAAVPLIVHFHGYDASVHSVLEEHAKTYPLMFKRAAAVIAVSRSMQKRLIGLGAPPDKVHYNPCGVDCEEFSGADPANAPPTFIAIGRFTEKKAPQITLSAFAQVYQLRPEARLRMIGDGPLLDDCRKLAKQLGVADAVTFMGAQAPDVVREELRSSRGFVQHSVESSTGDCEGTPVSILEAGATGLPSVSTRHAGIPDAVIEGETGFLVDERDVDGMTRHILRLVEEPALAKRMGLAARHQIQKNFSKEQRLGNLWRIIESCILTKAPLISSAL
jgi:colanic acid/amylovoran biosynthesis glycosyltransferase